MDTELLYRTHGKAIFNLALHYLRSTEDAEEITQDVFVAVHFQKQKFRGESEWGTYLYRITINKCIDKLRYRKRQELWIKWVPWMEDQAIADVFHHPGIVSDDESNITWLLEAIDTLPNKQRTAIILMKLDGKSQREAAEIMQIGPKAVESLVQRAKSSLIKKSKLFEGL